MKTAIVLLGPILAFIAGYNYPRDLGLESTKPIAFHYEVTTEAAKFLVLRDFDGGKCEP